MVDPIHITLEFNDIKDMFVAPDYDPFDQKSYEAAGLEIIANFLNAHHINAPASATIYLPGEQITPDLQPRFQEALKRFKQRRIIMNKNDMLSNKNEGMRMLGYSAVLVVLVIVLAMVLTQLLNNAAIEQAIVPLVTIILWVIIWQPVEVLFFDNLDPRRMNRVWKKVSTMPFEFKPSPAPEGSIGATGVTFDDV